MIEMSTRDSQGEETGMSCRVEEVEFFQEQGYWVAEGLISPEEIQSLKDDMLKICRGGYACPEIEALPAEATEEEVLQNFLCLHQVHRVSPLMRSFVAHPGIAEVLGRVVAPNVKCMQSMLFIKPPGFPGQAWHQDEMYIPTRDRSLCGAWIAIDEATVQNGCLWVVPGSHKSGYIYPNRAHNNPGEFDFAAQCYGFDDSAEVPVEVPAGTVVFFNGYLLHRSQKNRSEIYRRALVNHYMNAYSLLPWFPAKIAEDEQRSVAQADCRDVIMVRGEDPYAWKGYAPRQGVHARRCGKLAKEPAAAR